LTRDVTHSRVVVARKHSQRIRTKSRVTVASRGVSGPTAICRVIRPIRIKSPNTPRIVAVAGVLIIRPRTAPGDHRKTDRYCSSNRPHTQPRNFNRAADRPCVAT
jgi:hypothetical protein